MNFDSMNESGVRKILVECKGDLILASRHLRIRPFKLQQYVRSIPSLRAAWNAIEKVKADDQFDALTAQEFADEFESLIGGMRLDALESIHELSQVDPENAAMADIKLKASVALLQAGARPDSRGSEGASLLQELNQVYQVSATRIKVLRESVRESVTFELGSTHTESSAPIQRNLGAA